MTRYPIVFTYRELIVGNGFVATVETTGRCLMEDFGDNDVWVTGVHPSGFSAGSENQQSASEAFQREHRVALLDMADDAPDFDSFQAMVHDFHAQKSEVGEMEWWEAVRQVRTGDVTSDWLQKVSADTETKLRVRCISLDDSQEHEEYRADPNPSLNPGRVPDRATCCLMPARGQIPYRKVKRMLEDCAPGYTTRLTRHRRQFRFKGKVHRLQKGPHGSTTNYPVAIGQVRALAKDFEILDCAKEHLPQLR